MPWFVRAFLFMVFVTMAGGSFFIVGVAIDGVLGFFIGILAFLFFAALAMKQLAKWEDHS
jgi:hypothetical protein